MVLLDARDIIAFPGGDNASDTIIAGIHFNLTALNYWNFTLYDNGTVSNGSWCMLTFPPYQPSYLFPNGTWINGTTCYTPLRSIATRGFTAIGFAVLYGLILVGTLVNLTKHGRSFLPHEKRFWPIGRRWQWYWQIALCATAFVGLITAVDVDRYYIMEIPIVLTSFFWILMNISTMAVVWEAVRHWGSWMERQYIDPDPFALRQDDKRAKFEFWIPLVFYLFLWLDFFVDIPRNWEQLELQRSVDQQAAVAAPAATDSRFKSGAVMLFLCWIITVVSLRHSIQHYHERNRGIFNRLVGAVRYLPVRFVLIIPLALVVVFYQALSAWDFSYSPLKVNGNYLAIFMGGYAPPALIAIIQCIDGFLRPNEDQDLIRQRRQRGQDDDRELGLVKRPAWWRRPIARDEGMRDRIARNVKEVGGGRATAQNIDRAVTTRVAEEEAAKARAGSGAGIELTSINGSGRPQPAPYSGNSERIRSERNIQAAAALLFPNAEQRPDAAEKRAFLTGEGPAPPPYTTEKRGRQQVVDGGEGGLRPATGDRSQSTTTTNSITRPPMQIQSMLDV